MAHSSCRRISYTQERHMFHVLVQDGVTYLCMAEQVSPGGKIRDMR